MNELFQWLMYWLRELRPFVTVLPWEQAVRTRLGNRVRVLQPGWHCKVPFVDHINLVNTRLRICRAPTQTLTTLDRKTVSISMTIGFEIRNPKESLLRFLEPETCCAALVGSSMARFVGETASDMLTVAKLEEHAAKALADEVAGIAHVSFVRVAEFALVRTYRLLQEQWHPQTTLGERG